MQRKKYKFVLATIIVSSLTVWQAMARSFSPPLLRATSANGRYAVLIDWPLEPNQTVYSIHASGGSRHPFEIVKTPALWSIEWTWTHREPVDFAVSDDGSIVVLTTEDEKNKQKDRLEFWSASEMYATTTIDLPSMQGDKLSDFRSNYVSIHGDRVIVTNALSEWSQPLVLGLVFDFHHYRDAHRMEFLLSDASFIGSTPLPDRTERSVFVLGRWRNFWGAITFTLAIGLLCLLAITGLCFWIKKLHNQSMHGTR